MAAHVPAAAAGFRVADDARRAVAGVRTRVSASGGSVKPIRNEKVQARDGLPAAPSPSASRRPRAQKAEGAPRPKRNRREFLFKLAAEHVVHAERTEPVGVERRIEAVGAEARGGIERACFSNERAGEARGRVHRQMERDEAGAANRVVGDRLLRGVDDAHVDAGAAQPGGRRGQAERLVTELVG